MECNIRFAVKQVNARGAVCLPDGRPPLALSVSDSKQGVEDDFPQLRQLIGQKILLLFLSYSAADPALTNEKYSFWHFRFDANAPHAHVRVG